MKDKWYLVLCNCSECGHDTQLYGPYDDEKQAESAYPEGSIAGMTCCKRAAIQLNVPSRNFD